MIIIRQFVMNQGRRPMVPMLCTAMYILSFVSLLKSEYSLIIYKMKVMRLREVPTMNEPRCTKMSRSLDTMPVVSSDLVKLQIRFRA